MNKHNEHIEIEARWIHIDRDEIEHKLESLGAEKLGDFFFREWIFRHDDWAENHRRVRVRTDGTQTWLTYKANTTWAVDSTEEVEFTVSSAENAVKFMDAIGMPRFIHIEKKRTEYTLGDASIDIDTWPTGPLILEIEAPNKGLVQETASQLGLVWEDALVYDQKFVLRDHFNIDLDNLDTLTFDDV